MERFLPLFIVDVVVAFIGYALTVSWMKFTNTCIDENGKLESTARSFFLKMWIGIGLFGVACYFLMK
jgi:hypothetical protein